MKKIISILVIIAIIMPSICAFGAYYNTDYLAEMEKNATEVFSIDPGSYSQASPSLLGFTAEKDGMTLDSAGGVTYLKFFRTESYTDGGNLILPDSLFNTTGKQNGDYVVLSFITNTDETDGEHIYTLYGAKTNTAGTEILKFKYKNGGIYPCTSFAQNEDVYTTSPVIYGNNIPVRIFFIREANALKVVYQANTGSWSTVYETQANANAFNAGIGTIRSFVKFSTLGSYTALGNLSVKTGWLNDIDYSSARFMENLDRGLVAMKKGDGIYLSWRLLGTEEYDTSFEVYRNGKKIATVSDTTNYIDAMGKMEDTYYVVGNGDTSATVSAFSSGSNYFDIPLSQPPAAKLPDGTMVEYTPWDASAGDLDGDGEIEIVQRWDAPRLHAGQEGDTGGLILDAYELDGTVLWRIDLGVNVRCNTENVFTVYDYNSDGVCEIVVKTAPGSRDGTGRFVTEASTNSAIRNANNYVDYRSGSWATILQGDEYYTLFDGRNGQALDTIYYPFPRGNGKDFYIWGDDYGHRSDKFLDVPAYLDGTHPYVVTWRGIYHGQSEHGPGRTAVAAFRITEDNRFKLEYTFDTKTAGNKYIGQGNHNITVGDVDEDGCDEIISGNLCLDNDLSVLWCSGRGHGDALHLGNYDPTTKGLEYMTVHENAPYGMTVYNAATGEDLLHIDATGDTGRGVMANVGSGGYYQVWGAGTYQSNGGKNFSETRLAGQSYNYRIFWDGDTYDELLDAVNSSTNYTPVVSNYNESTGAMETLFTAWDSETINNTKATVALSADILGDWREEIVAIREDKKAIRIFVSDIYTENKVYTLLHDSQYRQAIAWQNEYYNQPPHIGFYLSGNNDRYDERSKKPNIQVAKYNGGSYTPATYVAPGVLQAEKKPNSKYLIDMDGDYYPAHYVLGWLGGRGELGNTIYSVTGRNGGYGYAASGNVRHSGVMRSWGINAKDGKFIVVAGNTAANNYSTMFSLTSKSAVYSKGKLHLDFAFLKNYSSDGTKDRGVNNSHIRLGSDVVLYFDSAACTLSVNNNVVHTFANLDDAQKWSSLDADIDVTRGVMDITIAFGDGGEYKQSVSITKGKSFNSLNAETYSWGCVLLDAITLEAEGSGEGYTYSTEGFDSTIHGNIVKGVIEMDLVAFETGDNVIGITSAESQAEGYGDLNIIVRFNPDGTMDAYNNTGYASYSRVTYNAGEKYHLRIETDAERRTYSAWVTDKNGKTQQIANNYYYRSSAPVANNLARLYLVGGMGVGGGKIAASNITFYNNISTEYITNAQIESGKLNVSTNGKLNVYIAFYNEEDEAVCYAVRKFSTSGTQTLQMPENAVYARLYTWDELSIEPVAAVRVCR